MPSALFNNTEPAGDSDTLANQVHHGMSDYMLTFCNCSSTPPHHLVSAAPGARSRHTLSSQSPTLLAHLYIFSPP